MKVDASIILQALAATPRLAKVLPVFPDEDLRHLATMAANNKDAVATLRRPPAGAATFNMFDALQAIAAVCTILGFFLQIYTSLPRRTTAEREAALKEAKRKAMDHPRASMAGECDASLVAAANAVDKSE